MRRNGNGPVIAIDIDGTIAPFHEHFLKFAEGWYGREMPSADDYMGDMPLCKFMGSSKATYRKCKLAYRQGGLKRSMPIYPEAPRMIAHLRKLGAEVWICTTRPYLSLDNIEPDTRHWLKRHKVQHDGVIFGEHKYRDLVHQVGSNRIVAILDDLPEMLDQAISLNLDSLIRGQSYNKGYGGNAAGYAVDLDSALIMLENRLRNWRDRNAS